ncbi:hypothetical protein AOA12_19460 [Microbacterium sp. No. 7]|nr:hypothetical protein AOA12_19460 [Microbacterium sp. No. 7]
MRITADRATCMGSGQCVFTDPDAFDQDDDGKVIVVRDEPGTDEERDRARLAVQICPSRALALAEG